MVYKVKLAKLIQKAGSGVFAAVSEVDAMVEHHAGIAQHSMKHDPVNPATEQAVSDWRFFASVAHDLKLMEAKLKHYYELSTANIAGVDAEPVQAKAAGKQTKVKIARRAKSAQAGAKAASSDGTATMSELTAKPVKAKKAVKAKRPVSSTISGNNAKVLVFLDTVLNKDTPTKVIQSDIAKGAGIAMGSVARAIEQLQLKSQIVEVAKGEFKRL